MSIVALFCKTDDFFLAYAAYLTPRSLQDGKPTETRGASTKSTSRVR